MTRKELPCYHCGWEQAHGENHRGKCPDHPDNRDIMTAWDYDALIPVGTYVGVRDRIARNRLAS